MDQWPSRADGVGDTISSEGFAVYAEEACAYLEQLLKYQAAVEITYSDQFWEIWDSYSRVAHKITVVATTQSTPAIVKDQLIDEIKKKLLEDPQFLEEIRQRLQRKDNPTRY